ncbi:MAG TPA: LysR family transcriptional regulator [Novosphingobium capsulatum]|jgi:DNA-binding transcriptional LysR family regulator|nr:LysR family transcriptional regulator [Novosphingobium capsulatum]
MAPLVEALQWFIRVAECGSFSAVAREAMTSQVMVGRRISMLEAHFHVVLLRRSTRGLALTEDGVAFLSHARRIVREFEAMEADLHSSERGYAGHVRVGTTNTFGCHLARKLPEFHLHHPGITVEMLLGDGFVHLVEDGLDLAMRTGQVNETTVVAKHLGDVPRYMVASPSYLERCGTPQSVEDLQFHDCALFSYGTTRQVWTINGEPVRVSGSSRTNSTLALQEVVRNGGGISLFAYFQVEDDIRTGRLVRVLPEAEVEPVPFYVTYPARQTLPARTRMVMNWIISEAESLIGKARR